MKGSTAGIGQRVGPYVMLERIASGGMASVYVGYTSEGAAGWQPVAIKRLHPHLAQEREFITMLLDEGRVAARLEHPNVVRTLDVLWANGELFLVMEYVHGTS